MAIALKTGGDGHLQQIQVGDSVQADSFERLNASGNLVVGSSLGGTEELQLASTTSLVRAMGDAQFDGIIDLTEYIQFTDMTAPVNPADGEGRLYKKTGDDGLFWLPDSAGPEVDLTAVGAVDSVDHDAGSANLIDVSPTTGNVIISVLNQEIDTTEDNNFYGNNAGNVGTHSTAVNNVAFGNGSLAALTSGDGNIAIGTGNLAARTTGSRTIAIGVDLAPPQGTDVTDNIYISTGTSTRSVIYIDQHGNTAFGGTDAGNVESMTPGGFGTGAYGNISIGRESGFNLTTGGNNTLVGDQAGQNISTGIGNVILGRQAAGELTTGSDNITIGRNASQNGNIGSGNTMIGVAMSLPGGIPSSQGDYLSIRNVIVGDTSTGNGKVRIGGLADATAYTGDAALQVLGIGTDDTTFAFEVDNSGVTNGAAGGLIVGTRDPSATISAAAGTKYWRVNGASSSLYINTSATTGTTWTNFLGGGDTFLDSLFRIQDDVDNTKELAFQVSGVTTATTRTITMPDSDLTLLVPAGLAGGQSIVGGTAASENLTLESTSNATKGNVVLVSGTDLDVNTGTIFGGSAASGDLTLESTSNATKGNVTIVSGTDLNMNGNTVLGNTTASADLTLESTSNATKGSVVVASGSNLNVSGNTVVGDTVSGGDLTLESTSNATKGDVVVATGTDLDLNSNDILGVSVASFAGPQTQTTSGTSVTIDFSAGNHHIVTLGSNITSVTLTDPPGPASLWIKFVQDATGGRTLTGWPANVQWPGGTAPTFGDAANAIRFVSFVYTGTTDDDYIGEYRTDTYS